VATLDDLKLALRESLKLQSHYALLLNDYDGGHRRAFTDITAWLKRLHDCGWHIEDPKE
jgi:hypothetical protein